MQLEKYKILFLSIVFLQFLSGCKTQSAEHEQLCQNILIDSPEVIKFTDIEKKLICGDPDDPAYKKIPLHQAKYMLKGFLQSRGYSHPRFVYQSDELLVYSEDKTKLSAVEVSSENILDEKRFERNIFRRFKNEVLTPDLLNEIEAKAKLDARNESYPCVKVTSLAFSDTGKVSVSFNNLMSFKFGPLTAEPIEGVHPEVIKRFTSFNIDEKFSQNELDLTEKRYIRQGIVQGTYFEESCNLKDEKFNLHQKFITGPPRTIRYGIGASTELGPMLRVSWSNQRFGPMASLLEARLQTSLKNQSLKFINDQYFWKEVPRRSLNSELSFERNDQNEFKESTVNLKSLLQWTRDGHSRFWKWRTGPAFIVSNYKTDTEEQGNFSTAAIEGALLTQTHEYELYDLHPEQGEMFQVGMDFRHPALGFNDPILKWEMSFLKLLWLGSFGKGSSIGGVKLSTSTTWVGDKVKISSLPPSVKWYGGGSDDLRGFKLNSLPDNNGLGALTKLSAKIEFRKTHLFEPKLEGFTFLDTAYFGGRPWSLEQRLWYSPGVGVRWLSPIGLVQTYLARSLSSESSANFAKDEGMFLYLGLGGLF